MNREKDVIALLENCGEASEAMNVGLLLEGRRIAAGLGGCLHALSVGDISAPTQSGLDGIFYLLKGELLSEYRASAFSWAIQEFLHHTSPRLLLMADSDRGRELAPQIAAYLNEGVVLGCVNIEIRGGELFYKKLLYGGRFEQEFSFHSGALEIVALATEALSAEATIPENRLTEDVPSQIEERTLTVPQEMARTKKVGLIPPDFRTVDISCAQRILGVGAGAAQQDLRPLLEELAELLESAMGATRPVVDDGYLPKEKMIGQTGKTVAPDFYLSLGISGSPHHIAGIQGAKKVVAINKDQRAPVFQFSDLGFIADLKTILPKLNRRIQEWRRAQS